MLAWIIPAAVAVAVLAVALGRFPWRWALAWVPRFFLARVPLLALLGLAAGPFVLTGPAEELFGNLFQLDRSWQVTLVHVYAFVVAWQCVHQLRLVFEYGAQRASILNTDVPRWLRGVHPDGVEPGRTRFAKVLRYGFLPPWVVGLPLTWVLVDSWGGERLELALGVLVAYAAEYGLVALSVRLSRAASGNESFGGRVLERIGQWAQRNRRLLRPGYTVDGRLHPGHIQMTAILTLAVALYGLLGFLGRPSLGLIEFLPALVFPIALLMMLVSICGALAFFFDGYRVPFLLAILALLYFNHGTQDNSHYFEVQSPAKAIERPAARAAFLARFAPRDTRPIIVVCAAGGGIQSASWTAHSLEGLARALGPDFVSSIAAVSGVSGGSVGLAYFLEELLASDEPKFAATRAGAETSVLATVAWGLSYPDFLRTALPFCAYLFPLDRGVALERAWALQAQKHIAEGPAPMWSRWVAGAASGRLPAAILNTTVMETGERLVFSSTRLDGAESFARDFDAECEHPHDVQVFSAARLSATFPWVSPAARPRTDGECLHDWHLVDGGYFDNFGVASAIEWMRAVVLETPGKETRPVFVLLINGFPAAQALPEGAGSLAASSYGPLTTMLKTRTSSQLSSNRMELELFQRAWREVIDLEIIEIRPRAIEQGSTAYSLSWHLTQRQIEQNAERWKDWENWPDGPLAKLRAHFR